MEGEGEGRDHREQHPQGAGEDIDGVLAGAASTVGNRVYQLHRFHGMDAEHRFDQEQAQHQQRAQQDGFTKGQGFEKSPFHMRHAAAHDQRRRAHGDAGDPPGIDGAAKHLRQHAPGPQKQGVQLPRAHHAGKGPGHAPAQKLRQVKGDGHDAEEEIQVAGHPLVQGVESIHDQDHRQQLAPLHDQLGQRLHDEGGGVLQLAFQQDAHGFPV